MRHARGGLRDEDKRAALHHSRLAIAAGADDATALAQSAFVIGILARDYDAAFSAFERAFVLSPSSALALSLSALIRVWAGEDATAVEQAEQALRLSPFDSLIYIPYLALAYAHLFANRFEEAALAASRSMQANPQFSPPCVLRITALVKLGRNDEARASAQRLLELEPEITTTRFVATGFTSPERLAVIADALQRAGLPE
jgi:tetratricopeptide (TPR) repeat protein